jgi:signal transduction histidine kinase
VASGGGEDEARERLAVIGEIAAEIAHELRNHLQVISTSAYLARQDLSAAAPHIAKVERNAREAQTIVDDLMSLARGEAARVEPVLFAEVLVAARADLDGTGAVYEDEVTPPSLRVRAHGALLGRLLHTLYENAVAVCAPRPARIATRARAEDGRVSIEVTDDGPGVPEDLRERIFDPLVTGRAGGTGLGLALAKRIATAHGGTISLVPSKTGARFRIELPA